MNLRLHSLSLLSLGLALVGCDNTENPENVPLGHADAALLAQTNTERALLGVIDSAGHLTKSVTLARLLSTFAGSSTECVSSGITGGTTTTGTTGTVGAGGAPNGTDAGTGTGGTTTTVIDTTADEECTTTYGDVTVTDLAELRDDAKEATSELIAFMRDELLTEANLESDDGTTSVYALGPALFCSTSDDGIDVSPVSAGGATSAVTTSTVDYDPDCVADVAKLSPKLILTSPKAGDVDMKLTLTSESVSPATFRLYQNQIAVDIDLAAIQKASTASGLPMDGVAELTGKLSGSITANGTLDYTVELGVPETIGALLGDEPEQFSLKFGASAKAISVNFNGNDERTESTTQFGGFDFSAPLGLFFSDDEENYDDTGMLIAPKAYTGNITAALAGLTGHLVYDGTTDVFAYDNMGMGGKPFVIKHENATLLSADVNADAGRVYGFSIGAGTEAGPDVTFSSTVDMSLVLGFSALAAQVSDIEEFLLKDSLKLLISGDKPALRLEREQVRVMQGTVEIQSDTYGEYDVIAATGTCLYAAETEEPPSSLAGLFTSGTCQ
jgi:hypothetical protein